MGCLLLCSSADFITFFIGHAYFMLSLPLGILDVFNLEIIICPNPTHQDSKKILASNF